jgi:probable F420-dependent oxidoreductase
VKFGLRSCNSGPFVDPAKATELLQAGEEAGFESAWAVDHVVVPDGYESPYPYSDDGKIFGGDNTYARPDPLIWLTYAAAVTTKIKLATGILILPQRNPVVTAKQVATLDVMARGRLMFGVGVGWLAEEFAAIGTPFERRGKRTDEYIEAIRALWTGKSPSYSGEFVSFRNANCFPRPVNGTVPIIIGGHTKAAARRAGRLGDGFFPSRGAPWDVIDLARETARECGRNPDKLEITLSMPNNFDDVPELAKRGVSRLMIPVSPMSNLTSVSTPDDVLRLRDVVEKYADA